MRFKIVFSAIVKTRVDTTIENHMENMYRKVPYSIAPSGVENLFDQFDKHSVQFQQAAKN